MPRNTSSRPPEPWASFLSALDQRLEERVDLHCIGGFALTTQFGFPRSTADIDILTAVPATRLRSLQNLAGEGSELHRRFKVYLQAVRVITYPED